MVTFSHCVKISQFGPFSKWSCLLASRGWRLVAESQTIFIDNISRRWTLEIGDVYLSYIYDLLLLVSANTVSEYHSISDMDVTECSASCHRNINDIIIHCQVSINHCNTSYPSATITNGYFNFDIQHPTLGVLRVNRLQTVYLGREVDVYSKAMFDFIEST